MNIPTTKTVRLCNAERFAIGLKELCRECNVANWSMIETNFRDGSHIGNATLWRYALGISNEL